MKEIIINERKMRLWERVVRMAIFILILPWLALISLTMLFEKKDNEKCPLCNSTNIDGNYCNDCGRSWMKEKK
jgi:hypothetical protein